MKNTDKKQQRKSDIDVIVQKTREALGNDIAQRADSMGINIDHLVRFTLFSKICKKVREQKGVSIEDAAKKLNVSQCDLKDIEAAKILNTSGSVLRKYAEYLGQKQSFEKWEKENTEVLKSFKQ